MANQSAGILLYRKNETNVELFLVHPGGPFWQKKDLGAWTIPKGEFTNSEDALQAAKREFEEETGVVLSGKLVELAPVKQKAGKMIYPWAIEGDIDPGVIISNTFEMEWPPKSGRLRQFPEIDKGAWFTVEIAKQKINPAQIPIIDELLKKLL